ncbi:ABC transporter ATP-binding protein [Abyssisolibacter fermentans]|uniref:ABC transporter ATP-binding protein n=1 Tax=Abyssisolibacter fermentans TaxID=1766203 RepID=UPI000834C6D5|nr:ABC transporter ATP-binding protein [Abyssisolibacter fermentans]
MSFAIEVNNLIKSYGNHTVINRLSFAVNEGEIFALLGANGAGKTTTLECIEGIRKYDSGHIKINGTFGVQLQSSSLPNSITVLESFKLFCKWNRVNENIELLDRFGLIDLKNMQYSAMSTGQKRRLHLMLALISNPNVVFLDEPTAGLDVEGRVSLHKEIRKLKEDGKTIIMASHDMAEVESLCDRIAILKDGKIAFTGTAKELTTNSYLNETKIYIKTLKPLEKYDFKFSSYYGMDQDYLVVVTTKIDDALLELLGFSKETNNNVIDVKIERATLEQRFIEIAKEGK